MCFFLWFGEKSPHFNRLSLAMRMPRLLKHCFFKLHGKKILHFKNMRIFLYSCYHWTQVVYKKVSSSSSYSKTIRKHGYDEKAKWSFISFGTLWAFCLILIIWLVRYNGRSIRWWSLVRNQDVKKLLLTPLYWSSTIHRWHAWTWIYSYMYIFNNLILHATLFYMCPNVN